MLLRSMLAAGLARKQFDIVPFPINYPQEIPYYVPLSARYFITIYDAWGRKKVVILKSLGIQDIEIMWERSPEERLTSGEQVRERIGKNLEWKHLVPDAVTEIIEEIGRASLISRMSRGHEHTLR
jgi:nicotinamide mononucleotide adenylyltransferase